MTSAEARAWRHVVLGNPHNRRVACFQTALERAGLPRAEVAPYVDLLDGKLTADQLLQRADVLRIESPGEDFEVEKRLIAWGAGSPRLGGCEQVGRDAALSLKPDRGRLRLTRQWYLGFRDLLRQLESAARRHPHVRLYNAPADIELMFDKPACQRLLRDQGVATPEMLADVRDYEDLLARAGERNWSRVFVKLAHGSSASGVVALHLGGPRARAVTSMEVVREQGEVRRYNNLRLRTYTDQAEIGCLVDYLLGETAQVEQWLPKASLDGDLFDLRILVIGGRAQHTVVRRSSTPLTNLHLGNRRGDLRRLRGLMGPRRWQEAMRTAERAASVFPGSLYVAVDLLLSPGFRRESVLETNAFGDLLPGVHFDHQDTYQSEIAARIETATA